MGEAEVLGPWVTRDVKGVIVRRCEVNPSPSRIASVSINATGFARTNIPREMWMADY